MKTIVILSTEPWGKMLLSKMHYAIELANTGHTVYFVNPPENKKIGQLAAKGVSSGIPNLTIIETRLLKWSLFLRHKFFFLYKILSNKYVNAIKNIVGKRIDEVWCFNPHVYINLKEFDAQKNILLLYDFYKEKHVLYAAQKADAVVSVSQLILDHYSSLNKPKLLMQHGLSRHFAEMALAANAEIDHTIYKPGIIKVGYMGNLLRKGLDLPVTQQVIQQNPEKEFHFWGPYSFTDNNVIPAANKIEPELTAFIQFLEKQSNVFLHGIKDQAVLAKELSHMDAFLFLYAAGIDVNAASNSHKILEYLSTGKVVISTYVSTYANKDLLVMCEQNNEDHFVELFDSVMKNLDQYNSREQQKLRIEYALSNTYKLQAERIQKFIWQ